MVFDVSMIVVSISSSPTGGCYALGMVQYASGCRAMRCYRAMPCHLSKYYFGCGEKNEKASSRTGCAQRESGTALYYVGTSNKENGRDRGDSPSWYGVLEIPTV